MQALLERIRLVRCMNAVAAGTSDQNGTGVDMQADGGYDGVLFIAAFGTLTATQVTSLKAQASDDDGSSDAYNDIAGSDSGNLDDGDDNECVLLDVARPVKRYIRPVVLRGTANAVIDGVFAVMYRGRSPASTQSSSVALSEIVKEAAEGTA